MTTGRRNRPLAQLETGNHNGHSTASDLVRTEPVLSAAPDQDWHRWRDLGLYIAVWITFITLRTYGDRTPLAHALTSADAHLERRLFGGELPTEMLQHRFASTTRLHWYDFVATSFEWSFFVVPHVLALAIWRRHPVRFRRYLRASALLLGLGLLIYYLVPSDPPWYLADRPISRIMIGVGRKIFDGFYTGIDRSIGEGNPIAAMPSIHFAIIVLLAAAFWSTGGLARWLTVVYAALMGVSLVYLGEHFVTDLAIGGIIAVYSWWLCRRWEPAVKEADQHAAPAQQEAITPARLAQPDRML